ncbi:glycosyltransferase family 4 protein [Beijerinckia mobilis]|uniref:glycosyltransferase family 4 protein n=1 Tax=Beijerinckia mobilis TaxID=231434 RepID=UPI00068A6A1E|nr:glycosyltransferase family 4 protein [Beijerinckia mobilis]
MRIAQVAPLFECVPPKFYGGTERIVSYLTEECVARGHEVTLFASSDSITSARLVSCCDKALRLNPDVRDWIPHHISMLEQVRSCAHHFDIIHFHIDLLHYPLIHETRLNGVTTLHGRLDMPDLWPLYRLFSDIQFISISDAQRGPMPYVNWVKTIHHGLPSALLPFQPYPKGNYLAFLGRIAPEKGPEHAIEIAVRSGMNLKVAAKIDKADEAYWHEVIAPMIARHPNVEYIGEINERQKAEFLGNAAALLFPIDWPEPFGLVMIEAMACGTPILAFRRGSVPEVIDNGQSGFIVDDIGAAVQILSAVLALPRSGVRDCFDRRFTARRMAEDHLALYQTLLDAKGELKRSLAEDRPREPRRRRNPFRHQILKGKPEEDQIIQETM